MRCIRIACMVSVIVTSFILSGCVFTRAVYVPHGQAVRLRETVKDVKVWVKIKEGKIVASTLDLHEGWYCLPLDNKE